MTDLDKLEADYDPQFIETTKELCRELHRQLGRDAMLRQNDPVETLLAFALALFDEGYTEGISDSAHLTAQRQSHAVTGDKVAALKIFESLFNVDEVEDDGQGFVRPASYDQRRPFPASEYETIRAALTNSVPQEVVQKVEETLRFYSDPYMEGYDFQITDYGLSTKNGEIINDAGARAKEALTLLQPYLNNGRGG